MHSLKGGLFHDDIFTCFSFQNSAFGGGSVTSVTLAVAVTNVNEGTGEADREDFDDKEGDGDDGDNVALGIERAPMMASWGCADVVAPAVVAGSA
jgi:hypothetical protein